MEKARIFGQTTAMDDEAAGAAGQGKPFKRQLVHRAPLLRKVSVRVSSVRAAKFCAARRDMMLR